MSDRSKGMLYELHVLLRTNREGGKTLFTCRYKCTNSFGNTCKFWHVQALNTHMAKVHGWVEVYPKLKNRVPFSIGNWKQHHVDWVQSENLNDTESDPGLADDVTANDVADHDADADEEDYKKLDDAKVKAKVVCLKKTRGLVVSSRTANPNVPPDVVASSSSEVMPMQLENIESRCKEVLRDLKSAKTKLTELVDMLPSRNYAFPHADEKPVRNHNVAKKAVKKSSADGNAVTEDAVDEKPDKNIGEDDQNVGGDGRMHAGDSRNVAVIAGDKNYLTCAHRYLANSGDLAIRIMLVILPVTVLLAMLVKSLGLR